jgi:hypothetical protein
MNSTNPRMPASVYCSRRRVTSAVTVRVICSVMSRRVLSAK